MSIILALEHFVKDLDKKRSVNSQKEKLRRANLDKVVLSCINAQKKSTCAQIVSTSFITPLGAFSKTPAEVQSSLDRLERNRQVKKMGEFYHPTDPKKMASVEIHKALDTDSLITYLFLLEATQKRFCDEPQKGYFDLKELTSTTAHSIDKAKETIIKLEKKNLIAHVSHIPPIFEFLLTT